MSGERRRLAGFGLVGSGLAGSGLGGSAVTGELQTDGPAKTGGAGRDWRAGGQWTCGVLAGCGASLLKRAAKSERKSEGKSERKSEAKSKAESEGKSKARLTQSRRPPTSFRRRPSPGVHRHRSILAVTVEAVPLLRSGHRRSHGHRHVYRPLPTATVAVDRWRRQSRPNGPVDVSRRGRVGEGESLGMRLRSGRE